MLISVIGLAFLPASANTYEVQLEIQEEIVDDEPEEIISQEEPETLNVESYIQRYFPEKAELMKRVAMCESGMRQFLDNGEPVQGPTSDYGLFQVHGPSWDSEAQKLGLDYKYSLKDNVKMARYIYDTQGISAWNPSRHCWQ